MQTEALCSQDSFHMNFNKFFLNRTKSLQQLVTDTPRHLFIQCMTHSTLCQIWRQVCHMMTCRDNWKKSLYTADTKHCHITTLHNNINYSYYSLASSNPSLCQINFPPNDRQQRCISIPIIHVLVFNF